MAAVQIDKNQFQRWMEEDKTVLADYWAPKSKADIDRFWQQGLDR